MFYQIPNFIIISMDDPSTRTCESELIEYVEQTNCTFCCNTIAARRKSSAELQYQEIWNDLAAAASLASLVTLLPLSLASAMQQRASAWEESAAAAGMEQVDLRSCSGRVFIVRPSLGLSWHGVCLLSFLFIYLFLFLGNAICLLCCWVLILGHQFDPPFSFSVAIQNCQFFPCKFIIISYFYQPLQNKSC